MNKTLTVNIGGMVFHIEEQAYEKLRNYLEAIRGYFTSSDGRDEIIQDIESRIAEIFTERIGNTRQVVLPEDVEFVMESMGRPEQVAGKEPSGGMNPSAEAGERGYRRLYRDGDDKVIGGVCSGISHYVGLDPVWLRLIFAAALFIWGSGVLLYLILLIIIPKAKTASEKLEMKGQPVNIDTIKKTIEEEVEEIRSRISGNTSNQRKGRTVIANFFDAIGSILVAGIRFIGGFIGIIFGIVILSVLFALFVTLLAMTGLIGDATLPLFLTNTFLTEGQLRLSVVALALVCGIPLVIIIYRLVRSFFKIKSAPKVLGYASAALWVIGMLLGIWLAFSVGSDFDAKGQRTTNIALDSLGNDTLCLAMLEPTEDKVSDDASEQWMFSSSGWSVTKDGDSARIGNVTLDIQQASGDRFELIQVARSRGENRKDAENNAASLEYGLAMEGNTMKFSDHFLLKGSQRFRFQKVQLILKVPVGKSVYISPDMESLLYDVENVHQTLDEDMVGKTWTMTSNGLQCDEFGTSIAKTVEVTPENVEIIIDGQKIDIDASKDSMELESGRVKINIKEKKIEVKAEKETK